MDIATINTLLDKIRSSPNILSIIAAKTGDNEGIHVSLAMDSTTPPGKYTSTIQKISSILGTQPAGHTHNQNSHYICTWIKLPEKTEQNTINNPAKILIDRLGITKSAELLGITKSHASRINHGTTKTSKTVDLLASRLLSDITF